MNLCCANKANGERCKAPATGPDGLCWAHQPQHAAKRSRMASRAAKSKAHSEVKVLRQQLKTLTEQVIDGELDTGRGAVANQLISTQIRLLEYERKAKDLDELVERLERLENARDTYAG
jgi:hypothetical protein